MAHLIYLVALVAMTTLLFTCAEASYGTTIFEADLTSGDVYITPVWQNRIKWMKLLSGSDGRCSRQGVVKITLPTTKYGTKRQRCKLIFDLYFQGDLSKGGGWNFNIGDSSNNGYGGDAGHTSNSAEVHNYRDDVLVYCLL